MVNVCVKSSVFGDGQGSVSLPAVTLKLASERVSLEELITRAVREQIATLKGRHSNELGRVTAQLRRQYLAASDIAVQAQQGKVALETAQPSDPATLDVDAEVTLALQAFRERRFRVYVDSEPVSDLQDLLTLTDRTSVTFLRLVPLVGG